MVRAGRGAMSESNQATGQVEGVRRMYLAAAAAAAAVVASAIVRATLARGEALWLDEVWTGVMASQHAAAGVWRQLYNDVNAPLYGLVAALWGQVGGLSDEGLRAPGLVFGCLAPLAALLPVPGVPRSARLLWCVLLAGWTPAFWFAQDARCYTLLFLLTALGAVAFGRLLARPALGPAFAWATVSSLSILTHYHAILLVACQGLIYLAVHRGRALRTWPALVMFLPAAGWIAYHLPRVAAYADPQVAWYGRMRLRKLWRLADFLFGNRNALIVGVGWAALAVVLGKRIRPSVERSGQPWLVVAASAAAILLAVGLGFLRPSLVDRYLLPFVPGLLLGLALAGERLKARWRLAPAVLGLAWAVQAAVWVAHYKPPPERHYSFEAASEALMAAGAQRLVFYWDHPAAPVVGAAQLREVGGFFFRRAGHPVAVDPVILRPSGEAQTEVFGRARAPGSAVLWMYDRGVPGTSGRLRSPHPERLDAAWRCHDYGTTAVGILACARGVRPASYPPRR